jgi:hypothetical protein
VQQSLSSKNFIKVVFLLLDDELDDVNLFDELLDGVLELALAGDEGGPELATHHSLFHPALVPFISTLHNTTLSQSKI